MMSVLRVLAQRVFDRFGAIRPRRQRGQMMVLFALAFIAMTAGVGMSADMGMYIVEQQHLQTAVDSAAIAGARTLVAYSGDPNALTRAQTTAQNYLTLYGYPSSAFTSPNGSLTTDSPAVRQFHILARRNRPTMLIKFIGISQLTAKGEGTANAELKADIYAANDVTSSMNPTDISNLGDALNNFVDMLGLDPNDANGPQVGIGRFVGERCMRTTASNTSTGGWNTTRGSPTDNTKWYAYSKWQTTAANGWCDPGTAPQLYTGGVFSLPSFGTVGVDRPPDPAPPSPTNACAGGDPGFWSPFYPAACTLYQLGKSSTSAHTAVGSHGANLRTGADLSVGTPTNGPPTAPLPTRMYPYRSTDAAGTSHTAALATAARELNSTRSRLFATPSQPTFRRVLILETDGVVCPISTPFSPTQAQNRAIALASELKNNPDPFLGIEIFVVMFWSDDGTQTCGNNLVDDSLGSLYPQCQPANVGDPVPTLAAAGPRTDTDNYLIAISSSSSGTCDHYFPWRKSDGANLTTA